jgi:Uma2 family endonuclease
MLMSTATAVPFQTVADLLHALGDVPAWRVRLIPTPGTATEQDLMAANARKEALYELVDDTLVEKGVGQYESRLALLLGYFFEAFLEEHDLGICYGADCDIRLPAGMVRSPDLSFVSWDKLPDRLLPAEAIAGLIPDLAVEVLSASNTRREMARKRREYFAAGVHLVWEIDPETETAQIFTDADHPIDVPQDGSLDASAVLPGLVVSLRRLFERAGRRAGR